MRRRGMSSAQIIPLGFLLMILLGAGLLMLPIATADGAGAPFLTALFTSTTSVCVTGLVVVDTFSYWSLFGKAVILVLIQAGGLGVVAVSSAVFLLLRKSFSIRNRALLRDSFDLDSTSGVLRFLRKVIAGVFLIEGAGALLYAFAFVPRYGFVRGLWYAVFHSISAFCNAGLDLIGPDSFIPFRNDAFIGVVTMLLIVLGGLGYVVWFDSYSTMKTAVKKKFGARWFFRHLSEHSKLVLCTTAALIVLGAGVTLLLEAGNPDTLGGMPWGGKILNAFFQSVTYRTAGFAMIPQASLRDGSVLVGSVLMFIGGSPMGRIPPRHLRGARAQSGRDPHRQPAAVAGLHRRAVGGGGTAADRRRVRGVQRDGDGRSFARDHAEPAYVRPDPDHYLYVSREDQPRLAGAVLPYAKRRARRPVRIRTVLRRMNKGGSYE